MRSILLLMWGMIIILPFANPSYGIGEGTAETDPVRITSDQLEVDKKGGTALFRGNVVTRYRDATILSERLKVKYGEANRMERIDAEGDVRINQQERVGTCQSATFFPDEKRFVMSGDPRVWQDGDMVAGEMITLYLDSDRMDVEGAKAVIRSREGAPQGEPAAGSPLPPAPGGVN